MLIVSKEKDENCFTEIKVRVTNSTNTHSLDVYNFKLDIISEWGQISNSNF